MNKNKIVIVFVLSLLIDAICFAGTPYKIRNLNPDQKILIGKKWCGKKDIFYLNQKIHWDENLDNQAFEAYDVNNTSTTYVFTKLRANNKDISGDDYIKSMIGKGVNDRLVFWSNDPLLLPIEIDSTYQYKIRIIDSPDYEDATIINNKIQLEPCMFDSYKGVVKIEIVRIKGDIFEAFYHTEIEIIQ